MIRIITAVLVVVVSAQVCSAAWMGKVALFVAGVACVVEGTRIVEVSHQDYDLDQQPTVVTTSGVVQPTTYTGRTVRVTQYGRNCDALTIIGIGMIAVTGVWISYDQNKKSVYVAKSVRF